MKARPISSAFLQEQRQCTLEDRRQVSARNRVTSECLYAIELSRVSREIVGCTLTRSGASGATIAPGEARSGAVATGSGRAATGSESGIVAWGRP